MTQGFNFVPIFKVLICMGKDMLNTVQDANKLVCLLNDFEREFVGHRGVDL